MQNQPNQQEDFVIQQSSKLIHKQVPSKHSKIIPYRSLQERNVAEVFPETLFKSQITQSKIKVSKLDKHFKVQEGWICCLTRFIPCMLSNLITSERGNSYSFTQPYKIGPLQSPIINLTQLESLNNQQGRNKLIALNKKYESKMFCCLYDNCYSYVAEFLNQIKFKNQEWNGPKLFCWALGRQGSPLRKCQWFKRYAFAIIFWVTIALLLIFLLK